VVRGPGSVIRVIRQLVARGAWHVGREIHAKHSSYGARESDLFAELCDWMSKLVRPT